MHQIHAFKQDNPFLQQLLGLLGVQHGRKYRIKRAIALKMRFPNLLFLEDTPLNIEGHGYNICFVKSKLRNPDRRIAEERVVSRMALYYTCQKTIIFLKKLKAMCPNFLLKVSNASTLLPYTVVTGDNQLGFQRVEITISWNVSHVGNQQAHLSICTF